MAEGPKTAEDAFSELVRLICMPVCDVPAICLLMDAWPETLAMRRRPDYPQEEDDRTLLHWAISTAHSAAIGKISVVVERMPRGARDCTLYRSDLDPYCYMRVTTGSSLRPLVSSIQACLLIDHGARFRSRPGDLSNFGNAVARHKRRDQAVRRKRDAMVALYWSLWCRGHGVPRDVIRMIVQRWLGWRCYREWLE